MSKIDIEFYNSNEFVLSQIQKPNRKVRQGERNINSKPRPASNIGIRENNYIILEDFPQLNILAKQSPALSNILELFIAENGVGKAWNARTFQRALGVTFEGLTNAWISNLLPNEKDLIDSDSCMRVFRKMGDYPIPDGVIIDTVQPPIAHTFLEYKTNYNRQEKNLTQLMNMNTFIQNVRGEEIYFKSPTAFDMNGQTEQYHSLKIAQNAEVALVVPYEYHVKNVPNQISVIESPFSRNTTIDVTHAALSDYQTFIKTRPLNKFNT